jgi:hypothetical protein
MSSGGTPARETASEQKRAEVVDSATRLNAYPGDLVSNVRAAHPRDGEMCLLSAFFTLEYIGVNVYIRDEAIQY